MPVIWYATFKTLWWNNKKKGSLFNNELDTNAKSFVPPQQHWPLWVFVDQLNCFTDKRENDLCVMKSSVAFKTIRCIKKWSLVADQIPYHLYPHYPTVWIYGELIIPQESRKLWANERSCFRGDVSVKLRVIVFQTRWVPRKGLLHFF